jgi:regulator of sigma E protease
VDLMGDAVYSDSPVTDPHHFLNQSKFRRFVILVMGPLFNFLLAFFLYWGIESAPKEEVRVLERPLIVGMVRENSPEWQSGLRPGDELVAWNGHPVDSYESLIKELLLKPGQDIEFSVKRDQTVWSCRFQLDAHEADGVGQIHFAPAIRLRIQQVEPQGPGHQSGLKAGDVLLAADGTALFFDADRNQLSEMIQKGQGQPVTLSLLRSNERLTQTLRPVFYPDGDQGGQWRIGISIGLETQTVDRNWREGWVAGWERLWTDTVFVGRAFVKLFQRELPVKSLSGPISVGKVAKEQLDRGLLDFLFLMAIISINLAIFNLLPIPVLDGGDLFVILVEAVARREFALATKVRIKMVGFAFLMALMVVVLVGDLFKIL